MLCSEVHEFSGTFLVNFMDGIAAYEWQWKNTILVVMANNWIWHLDMCQKKVMWQSRSK